MSIIDNEIRKHDKNQQELKKLYLGNKSLKFEKAVELMCQQDQEYKKMIFLKNFKKALNKKN